jgi:hypothetical protein
MIEKYLQLLNEADEQMEVAQAAELRKRFADAVKSKKEDVDQDFIANLSKDLNIPQEEVEKMLVDFAINYSSIISPIDTSSIDEAELEKGAAHEKSHHDVPDEVARRIAAENLLSDPNYYKADAPAKEELAPQEPAAKEAEGSEEKKSDKSDSKEPEKPVEEKKSC